MTKSYLNPWSDQGLTAYEIWAKDAGLEDRSLRVVAETPEHAIKIWLQHYAGWPMNNIEQGPDVRTMGLPRGAGVMPWSLGKEVTFARRVRSWRGSAACRYTTVEWARA